MTALLDTLGRTLYNSFGAITRRAVKERNGEYCAILAPSLAWLLDQEEANYWGTRGMVNYNSLVGLCHDAIKTATDEGYPAHLKDGMIMAKKIMKRHT